MSTGWQIVAQQELVVSERFCTVTGQKIAQLWINGKCLELTKQENLPHSPLDQNPSGY